MNSLSAGIKEIWDKQYQVTHYKIPVYPAIANLAVGTELIVGDTLHREYPNEKMAFDVGPEGSYQRQNATDTDETLVITDQKESSIYIKDLDRLQNHLDVARKHAETASKAIFQQIDADVLGEAKNFGLTLDDGDFGGISGNGITVSPTNVVKLFTGSLKKMQRHNINIQNLTSQFTGDVKKDRNGLYGVAIISPDVYQTLLERVEGKETVFGDRVAQAGHAGRYMGFDIFVSNNLAGSAVLSLATNPTDGDTLTINGTVLTFKNTLGTTVGNVKICSSVDKTRANLAAALNAPTTSITEATDAGFVAFAKGSDEHKSLQNITATNNDTADTLTLYQKGAGYIPVSETLTNATDGWQAGTQIQHCLIGVSKAIDVAIQKTPNAKVKPRSDYIGDDIVTWTAYGIKVFHESLYRMINVKVRTDAY